MKTRQLIQKIYQLCPKKLQEPWDYCGRQIGKTPLETKKVLICLDFDSEVLPIAREFKPDLIITHHPFIFGTRAKVLKADEIKSQITREVEEELQTCIYSFHTCYDSAEKGMNYALGKKLELNNLVSNSLCPMMKYGELPYTMSFSEACNYIKSKLDLSYCLGLNYGTKNIKKVGIIGGGGAREYIFATEADLYISGDCAHHTRREMIERKINYIDIPHECESVFVSEMRSYLLKLDPSLEIKAVVHEVPPICY